MDASSSGNLSIAKVKVEYHDPSGVFSLIADQFDARLPLHNLNWKSPSRPLRSIESLHVELLSSTSGAAANADRGAQGSASALVKERRHQIPGLRQTPYLKIFLLRCDDAEAYKSTARKAVREWLKAHTPPSQVTSKKANSQENHDAFEWMVLHIVLPGTRAASEKMSSPVPGARPDSAGSDKTKILNKGANTLLEKLKADFNGSNKGGPDRVAQLKLNGLGGELTQDQREEWDDTIAKIKALILASFDMRVRQYEMDIQEKEAQRVLPGWNFCTFFVLKEGLARGFESVGLLDDALVGYEELSAELETIHGNDDDGGTTASLLPRTKDLEDLYTKLQDRTISSEQNFWGTDNPPLSTAKKNYREMILANNISIFDFKCYILARKMAILLRMSRATREGAEDLVPLGHLCQLAVLSIPNISRIMQADLQSIAANDAAVDTNYVVQNIVSSWVYAATQQVLADTNSAFLAVSSPNEPHFSSLLKGSQSAYPTRKSSLGVPAQRKPKDDAQALFDQLKSRVETSRTAPQNRSGKDYLALQRAQLLLLQRRQVETIANRARFTIGWTKNGHPGEFAAFKDVDLNDEDSENEDASAASTPPDTSETTLGICNFALYDASTSKKALRSAYEALTRESLDLFFTAGQSKNFERMLADLAILRYQAGDYAGAANYFAKVIPVYSHSHWTLIETEMLLVHAKCLKFLNRRDDYVRMLLGLLALVVASKTDKRILEISQHHDLESYTIQGQTILDELNLIAAQLPYDIAVNLYTYFPRARLSPHIQHDRDTAGFHSQLDLKSVFEGHIVFSKVSVVLASEADDHASEIHLGAEQEVRVIKGSNSIDVSTKTVTSGTFILKSIILQSGRILFTHELHDTERSASAHADLQSQRILVYPRDQDLGTTLSSSRTIYIDRPRCLELQIHNGDEEYKDVVVALKPASSGLRLHTSDAHVTEDSEEVECTPAQSEIALKLLGKHSRVTIAIPYELDDVHNDITLKVEIRSKDGALDYRATQSANIELPLDVNVHDMFKADHIFQRFHLKSATEMPLEVLGIDLGETEDYKIEAPANDIFPTIIFPKHPATYMYNVKQAADRQGATVDREVSLVLSVEYQCYRELITGAVVGKLRQDLADADVPGPKSLLVNLFRDRIRQTLALAQITTAVLTRSISCPDFDAIGWSSLVHHLPSALAPQIKAFLEQWHKDNPTIALPDPQQSKGLDTTAQRRRKLVISVPLPHLDILQIARLQMPDFSSGFASVGVPFCATMTLEHTRKWSASHDTEISEASHEFMYEIDAPIDTWLIGGQRRCRFTAKPDERQTWQVFLIPLQAGRLLVPTVDVRVVGKDTDELTCETEYVDLGRTLTVVDELKRTTVALVGNESQLISAET